MPTRRPLGEIIERVPVIKNGKEQDYLDTTIYLETSIEPGNREETVRLYYFAKTLKTAFEEILLSFAEPMGRGFWLTAEYGVGKSHFLATLACLLADNSDAVWNSVHEEDIRNYRFKFERRRLFPVVAGLRGKTAISMDRPITLLDQLEKEIDEAVTRLGLDKKINITPVAETINLFDGFNVSLQGTINNFIQQRSGQKAGDLKRNHPDRFADFVRRFFKENNIPFEPKVSVNDRLLYLYKQIVDAKTGYNGLLFIIDEYESWLSQRQITSPEGMFDSSVIQALTEILPKQYGCEIFTVIASQTDIPAQLAGRLKPLPLLAGSGAERDYHVICAYRVRRYKPDMEKEAKLYYHDFYNEFAFYKNETEETFLDTFPFHPLAYETVRRFTSSVQDMPGVRLGLNIFYDVMKSQDIMALNMPVAMNCVHEYSSSLQNALASPRFGDSQKKFRDALAQLPRVFDDEEDVFIGKAILTILYIQFVISGEQAIPMTASELADATLTFTGPITGEQRVEMLLGEMAVRIPQLEYDPSKRDRGARFIPKEMGPTPQQLLEVIKEDCRARSLEIKECWEGLLVASPTETRGLPALFNGYAFDKSSRISVDAHQLSYEGEALLTRSWRPELGAVITDPYTHFRLVYVLNKGASIPGSLLDSRIVVVEAAELSEKVKDMVITYLAAKQLMKDYGPDKQKGPDAAQIRAFAESTHADALADILRYQLEPFQKGAVHTKDGLNLDLLAAMTKPTPDQRHAALIRPTLENAYKEFSNVFETLKIEKVISPADCKNLFTGLVQADVSAKAVRSTLEQKAVGLGLATAEDPKKLNPKYSRFFQLLDDRLQKSPANIIWNLLKEMAYPPYGIPPQLCMTLLLIYVRSKVVPSQVEIQLNPQHNVVTQDGQRLKSNRITRASVVDVKYQSDMEKHVESLVVVSGPDWNNVQPFAKLIWEDAKPASNPHDIDIQVSTFLSHMAKQAPAIHSMTVNLKALSDSTGDPLAKEDVDLLQKVEELFTSEDLDVFDAKRRAFAPDIAEFKKEFDRVYALRHIAGLSTQVIAMLSQLKGADVGTDQNLSLERDLLLPRYRLTSLIGNPSGVASLLNETEKFLQHLHAAEEVQAKRNQETLEKIKTQLDETEALLLGLGKLNQILTIGPPQGHDLADAYDKLCKIVDRELSGESTEHHKLSYVPPEDEAAKLRKTTQGILSNRLNVLRGQLEKVIQERNKDDVKTLLDLLQLNKLNDVAANLTPAVIETIQKILDDANTQVIKTRVIDRITSDFSVLAQSDIDRFLAQLRSLLEREFAEQKKEGKKILLSFK